MKSIIQEFTVPFSYRVDFTENLFAITNQLFADTINKGSLSQKPSVLFILDSGMYDHHPDLMEDIKTYASNFSDHFNLVPDPVIIPGGERAKNNSNHVQTIIDAIETADLDRHSYVSVIGGGAVTDTAGYAAAIAHRGIRLIRVPTTVLAQNDAAVGVKNGVNAYGKKNFLGTFVPPEAVLNDFKFLETLSGRQWRAGISEAIKVALIKDAAFFEELEKNADLLSKRDKDAMTSLIFRCAELHLEHISSSGDPFERGSSRPLDFGHWVAHKLEQLTNYELLHGEAVAIGIVVDTIYSRLNGFITDEACNRTINLFKSCGFSLFVPELQTNLNDPLSNESVLYGLQEFREHLGGELTIMLLDSIGKGVEVHDVDMDRYRDAINELQTRENEPVRS